MAAKQLKVTEILKRLEAPLPWKRLLVHGKEGYLTHQFLKKLSSVVAVEKFSADEELEYFLNFSGTSLFGGQTIPVLTGVELLPSKLRKKSDRERFLSVVKRFDSWVLVSFEEIEYKKLSGELFKEILNLTDAVVVSEPYSEKGVYNLLRRKFSSFGKDVSLETVRLIVELVGTDLQNLKQETDKLIAYPGEITEEVVKELVFSLGSVNVFELIFSYIDGDKKGFIEGISRYFESGGDGLMLLGLLQSQLRNILEVKSGGSVRLPRKVVERFEEVAASYPLPYLLQCLKRLHEAEFSIKMGEASPDEALKRLILKAEIGTKL